MPDTAVRRITAAELREGDIIHTVLGLYRIDRIRDLSLCRNLYLTDEHGRERQRGISYRETALVSRPGEWAS